MSPTTSRRGEHRDVRVRNPFVVLATTLLAVAVMLRLADAASQRLLGEPAGLVRFDTVEALERASGRRVPVPVYFPDSLNWPPSTIGYAAATGATLVVFDSRRTESAGLAIADLPDGEVTPLRDWLPAGDVVQRAPVWVDGERLEIVRQRARDGRQWSDLLVPRGRRVVLIRVYGDDRDIATFAEALP